MIGRLRISTTALFQPEKEYAFWVLFHEILGLEYDVEYQADSFHRIQLPNGQELKFTDQFAQFSKAENAALALHFDAQHPDFDPFANSFFLLTRWEEAFSTVRDKHGRFPAQESQAWKQGFLQRPVVNEWADQLWQSLVQLGIEVSRKTRKFKISVSCDVDHPLLWWSSAARMKTLAGAIFKRFDLKEADFLLKNHFRKEKDPYDVFDEWLDLLEKHQLKAQFNFLGARPKSSNCWYPIDHPFVKNLMQKLTTHGHSIGFHPSYEAFEDQQVFNRELASLQEISPVPITAGRQHYLRFAAPQTWQMWAQAGLREDSTLGYPEAEGFRCGICHDFPVFDLKQRKMLQLREKPLIAMDVTLAQYRAYTPEKALQKLQALRKTVERHQGDFTILWHNSSWNTPQWADWKAVFLAIIKP